jgi:hypothetical protein
MNRRRFISTTSTLALSAAAAPAFARFLPAKDVMDRIGMGTLLFRSQIKTRPEMVVTNELTLLDIPQHHRDVFGVKKLEFWSDHLMSLDKAYLTDLKGKIKKAGCELLNFQIDTSPADRTPYDLATLDEERRKAGVEQVKKWLDVAAFLGTKSVRVNPGGARNSSVEQSIKSYQELLPVAKSKNIIIVAANHSGIERDVDKHLEIVKGAPGLYTQPDFGNYNNPTIMYDSLAKILPFAYVVSAKVSNVALVDGKITTPQYDFDKCVQLSESTGFKGVYIMNQWGNIPAGVSTDDIGKWMVEHIKANIKA